MISDVICYWKLTSFVALDVERRYKYMLTYVRWSEYWQEFFSAKAESLKKLNTSNLCLSFIMH